MKKKQCRKILVFLLIVAIILSNIDATVFAVQARMEEKESTEIKEFESSEPKRDEESEDETSIEAKMSEEILDSESETVEIMTETVLQTEGDIEVETETETNSEGNETEEDFEETLETEEALKNVKGDDIESDGNEEEAVTYNGHKYKLFDHSMTWTDANNYCESLGGHLLTINFEGEQNFITSLIDSSSKKNIWLGAELNNGSFKWVTDEEFSYTNWDSGEPNNVFGMQNAIMMYTKNGNGTAGKWNDESKEGRDWPGYNVSETGFVCEWDASIDAYELQVYSSITSCTVGVGQKFQLRPVLAKGEDFLKNVQGYSFSIKDKNIVDISNTEYDDFGPLITLLGKKEGKTTLEITHGKSGKEITLNLSVVDGTITYDISDLQKWSVDNGIFNAEIFMDEFHAMKQGDGYLISFNAYNGFYHAAAVEVYDKNGNLVSIEEIKKCEKNPTGIVEVIENTCNLINSWVSGKMGSFKEPLYSKQTPISNLSVPDGGYIIVSNNVSKSIGAWLYNEVDLAFFAYAEATKSPSSEKAIEKAQNNIKQQLITKLGAVETQKKFIAKCENKVIESLGKKVTIATAGEVISNMLDSNSGITMEELNIDMIELFADTAKECGIDIAEEALEQLSGPAGEWLEILFDANKYLNRYMQLFDMANTLEASSIRIDINAEDDHLVSGDVIVSNKEGESLANNELTVKDVTSEKESQYIIEGLNNYKQIKILDITMYCNKQEVQPNGIIVVKIPLPAEFSQNTTVVYRAEDDGTFTDMQAKYCDNYMVFETNHLSKYVLAESLYQYTIQFDGNGAESGELQPIENCEADIYYVLPQNSFMRKGYLFTGWNTKADGTGKAYTEKESVVNLADNNVDSVTLYAQWRKLDVLPSPEADISSESPIFEGTKVTLSCKIADARIYYTLDGTIPTQESVLYQEPIILKEKATDIKAVAVKEGYADSDIAIFNYVLILKSEIGDILPEDIPEEGIKAVPDGLWIAGIEKNGYIYTGKSVKPTIRVYDYNRRLIEGRDYTVSYKNNIKVNIATDKKKAPTLIVKGKGNYTGTETAVFQILAVDLNDPNVIAEDIRVAYNKKQQKIVPILTYNGKQLENKKDFTVSYPALEQGIKDAYTAPGTYDIVLTSKSGGNFTGTRSVKLTITENILIHKAIVNKIPNQSYTGSAIKPLLTVTMKNQTLAKDIDYTVAYENNTEIGTATAVVTGIGKYTGTKKVTFEITGKSLKKAVVTGIEDRIYNGKEQIQKLHVSINGHLLSEGKDYEVLYANHINAGTATVTIKGIHAYSGSLKKSFRIQAYDLGMDMEKKLNGMEGGLQVKYRKGGCEPEISLSFDGTELKKGMDYVVSYQNNRLVTTDDTKKLPTIVIKGKGNFKGMLRKNFQITKKSLDDEDEPVTIVAPDVGFVKKAGKYISKPILTDVNGRILKAGIDYESKIVYSLKDGTVLTDKSIVDAETKLKLTVHGKGAYSGTLETEYRITKSDFSKVKIKIIPQSYTGKEVLLDENDISVSAGGTMLVYGKDYEIVENSYRNNINKGNAAVIIAGKGNYGGTKKVKFKITAKQFSWFWRIFG